MTKAADDPEAQVPRRIRWTEHGPEVVEDELPLDAGAPEAAVATPVASPAEAEALEDPSTGDGASVDDGQAAVRARLAARGMVRTEPSVRIREVTGPRPEPAPVDDKAPPGEDRPSADNDTDADAERLEPDPGGATEPVRCLSCRSTQPVAIDATGYRCDSCDRVWRWAICGSCDQLAVTPARQESWRCRACGTSSRSWWRTAAGPRDAALVVGRKRAEASARRRRNVLGIVGRQRTRIAILAVVLLAMVAGWALLQRAGTVDDPAQNDTAICADVARLRSDLAAGTLLPAPLRIRLDELATKAADSPDEVRIPAQRLAASGRPGDEGFDKAMAAMANACP